MRVIVLGAVLLMATAGALGYKVYGPASSAATGADQTGARSVATPTPMVQSDLPPTEDPAMGADRIPHQPIRAGEVREMTIKEMGNFEFDPEKDADVPADVKRLDGGHVRLTGFMMPLTQAQDIADFAIAPGLMSCCFGQPPGVQHIVTCHVSGQRADFYYAAELLVEGVIHVNVKREDGYTTSIFELDVTSIKRNDE